MNRRVESYSGRGRSSSFDTFTSAPTLKINQRKANGTSSYDRFMPSYDEHDIKTRERIQKLSMDLRNYERISSSSRNSKTSKDDLLDPEQILLYINTGGKYNSEIFRRKSEYKNMVLDIYNVGGHCLKVMINSFKNILANPKVSNVNMTRMDRLVNFLSLVRDLHKNYCDPIVCDMFKTKNTRSSSLLRDSTKSQLDFASERRAKSTSYIPLSNNSDTNSERRRFNSADSNIKNSISSKVLLNIINGNNDSKRSEIREIYFQKLKENVNNSTENKTDSRNRSYSSGNFNIYRKETKLLKQEKKVTNVKDIFESLKECRSKLNMKEKSEVDLRGMENKHSKRDVNNSVESEFITNFLNYSQLNKNSNSQRIADLQKLLCKLKEIKLGFNYQDFENREKTPKANEVTVKDLLYSKINTTPEVASLSKESVSIKDENNVLSISGETVAISPRKSPDVQSPKTSRIDRIWELDTPFISHRTIDFDRIYNLSKSEINEKGLLSLDTINTGISPKRYEPSKAKVLKNEKQIDDVNHEYKNPDVNLSEPENVCDGNSYFGYVNKNENSKLEVSNLDSENINFSSHILKPLFNTMPSNLYIPDEGTEIINVYEHENRDISKDTDLKDGLLVKTEQNTKVNTEFDSKNLKSVVNQVSCDPILFKDCELNSTEWSANKTTAENEDHLKGEIQLSNSEVKVTYNYMEESSGELSICKDSIDNGPNEIISTQVEEESNISLVDETESKINEVVEIEKALDMESETIKSDDRTFEVERLNIEYFTSLNEHDLKKKIEEYNYWYENMGSENYINLSLDGLSIDEFYYKGIELIPKCYDGIIDMSSTSIRKMCIIIYENLSKLSSLEINGGRGEQMIEGIDDKLSILLKENIGEETLLSFIHNVIMRDSRYLEFNSSLRKELSPPDDNYILLIIDLMREILIEWRNDNFGISGSQITIEAIIKQVDEILKKSYEPYLSEVNSDEWVLKKIFHAPNYPNILESEKELLNIEHLFKYHTCEDLITSDYINMDRTKWLKTNRYYLPIVNDAIEHVLQDLINEIIIIIKSLNHASLDNK
ncbi:hypothetical protein RS030_81268 [Cryptosporidium xiaoi]|uniref:Uncharacterized protein n=1 Tax=Cryptosporidium xiaoi TaxID=659607 RepID=A0AAV9XV08_9CRYT